MARKGDRRGAYKVWLETSEEKNHVENLGLVGRIIIKWIYKKWSGVLTGMNCLRVGTDGAIL